MKIDASRLHTIDGARQAAMGAAAKAREELSDLIRERSRLRDEIAAMKGGSRTPLSAEARHRQWQKISALEARRDALTRRIAEAEPAAEAAVERQQAAAQLHDRCEKFVREGAT